MTKAVQTTYNNLIYVYNHTKVSHYQTNIISYITLIAMFSVVK